MSKIQYHVKTASGAHEDYCETLVYIFDDKEQAIAKAKELYKEDEQNIIELKKKHRKTVERLCEKYGVTSTGEDTEEIIEGLIDLTTDEEYEEYHNLWLDLNYYDYEDFDHYVYEYEIDDTGYVTCKGGCFGLRKKDNE